MPGADPLPGRAAKSLRQRHGQRQMLLLFRRPALLESLPRRRFTTLQIFLPEGLALMFRRTTIKSISTALLIIALLSPLSVSADDPNEMAGIGIGITAGNMWFAPIKGISVFWGVTGGALSFIFYGGDMELTKQTWENATQGPYLITPDVARMAIGERPELEKR